MASEQEQHGGVMSWAGSIVEAVRSNAYLGGELQAAGRQGANELGAALKAFPDSIQIDEPGAVFNPLYRDIPGDPPQADNQRLPSPSEIARDMQPYAPEQDHGQSHGRSM